MRTRNEAGYNSGCREFRAALSRALEGLPVPEELTALGWHEHLLSCEECRHLLEREEALEELLATLPRPKLPPDLTRRVLQRLREGTGGLDRLLELADAAPPAGLTERVTAGLRAERALDRLLDADSVSVPEGLAARVRAGIAVERLLELDPEPVVPEGLSARVLGALERERWRPIETSASRFRVLRSPVFYAAAAGLVFMVTSLVVWMGRAQAIDPTGDRPVVIDDTVDRAELNLELLANLDLLEDPFIWAGTEIIDPAEDLPLLLADELDQDDEELLEIMGEKES